MQSSVMHSDAVWQGQMAGEAAQSLQHTYEMQVILSSQPPAVRSIGSVQEAVGAVPGGPR